MHPRKKNRTKADLPNLLRKHEIKFEGPLQPSKWPPQQKHLFLVIRDIWATRYDEYMNRAGIDKRIIKKQQDRVRDLRKNAYMLRNDVDNNEDTWRHSIERLIFERFTKDIVWLVSLIALKLL